MSVYGQCKIKRKYFLCSLVIQNYISFTLSAYFRPTWIDVNLDAVRSNVRLLKEYIGKKVHLMTAVKANGYGHGMLELAQAAISAGATWLGGATMDEAIVARSKPTQDVPILILGYVAPQHLSLASRFPSQNRYRS